MGTFSHRARKLIGIITLSLLAGFNTAKSHAQDSKEGATATLSLASADSSATDAAVRVDGEPRGKLPLKINLPAGRHLVQVGRVGYQTFSKWVDLAEGAPTSLAITLQSKNAATGAVLVQADVTGVPVFIDGVERGKTPAVVNDLSVGEHVIEIRPTAVNHRAFQRTVQVVQGQQLDVSAQILVSGETGSLRIITNVPSATVTVDGEAVGFAPATKDGLSPGVHKIGVSAAGYATVEKTVEVAAGKQRVVSLRLGEAAAATAGVGGRIIVRSDVPGARVDIDGADMGEVPVVANKITPGIHTITVSAEGYKPSKQTCDVGADRDCELDVDLSMVGAKVRVESNVPNGELWINGEHKGAVPWEGDVPTGVHSFEVRSEGFVPQEEYLEVTGAPGKQTVRVELSAQDDAAYRGNSSSSSSSDAGSVSGDQGYADQAEEPEPKAKKNKKKFPSAEGFTHTAATLPPSEVGLDLSIGWVHLFELRMSVGLTDFLDAGVAIRSFGRLTDFEGRLHAGWRVLKPLSLGLQTRLGGGIGPARTDAGGISHKTNDVFFALEGLTSLHFGDFGAFTFLIGLDVTADRWDWSETDRHLVLGTTDRQRRTRVRLGVNVDFAIGDNWNTFAGVEGVLGDKGRRVLGDVFGGRRGDSQIYARFGFTYNFGGGAAN